MAPICRTRQRGTRGGQPHSCPPETGSALHERSNAREGQRMRVRKRSRSLFVSVLMTAIAGVLAYVLGSMYWISTMLGFIYGQIPGMVDALQKNIDGISLTDNEIYLITATITMATVVGFGVVAITNDRMGRRWNFILFSIPVTVNWIILYFAENMFMFMISRILVGTSVGALIILYLAATAEYTSPNTRAFFMNMISTVAPAIGTGLGHYLGIILHWRTMALIGATLGLTSSILPYFWIESPQWLATQGRFDECRQAFRKLNQKNRDTEKELHILIKMENGKLDRALETNSKSPSKRFLLALKRRYAWELILNTSIIFIYVTATCKAIFSALATVVVEEMTGTSDVILFTLAVDVSMIIGSVLSCILISRTSMRKLLFSTGFIAIAIMFLLSICLFFKNDSAYSRWLSIGVLAVYFIVVNTGPYPICEALIGEIFPLDLKFYFLFFTSIVMVCFVGTYTMLLPHMVLLMGYHGFFLFNAVIMTLTLGFLWLKLPETKGKTLQEIEVYFKVKNFDVDKALDDDQIKALI